MGATTPILAIPYPTGTDRVMDGDNAIQALAERVEAKLPWGCIGLGIRTDPVAGINTTPFVPSEFVLSLPAKMPAGRRLRLSCLTDCLSESGSGSLLFTMTLVDLAGGQALQQSRLSMLTPGYAYTLYGEAYTVSTAGAHQYHAQFTATGGGVGMSLSVNRPAVFAIEDLGPAAALATALPAPETPNQPEPEAQPEGTER